MGAPMSVWEHKMIVVPYLMKVERPCLKWLRFAIGEYAFTDDECHYGECHYGGSKVELALVCGSQLEPGIDWCGLAWEHDPLLYPNNSTYLFVWELEDGSLWERMTTYSLHERFRRLCPLYHCIALLKRLKGNNRRRHIRRVAKYKK